MEGALYCKAHFEQLFKESGGSIKRSSSCNFFFFFFLLGLLHNIIWYIYILHFIISLIYFFCFILSVSWELRSGTSNYPNSEYLFFFSPINFDLFPIIKYFCEWKIMIFFVILQGRSPSKLSSMFSGTQEKCAVCKKTVYPLEKVYIFLFSRPIKVKILII